MSPTCWCGRSMATVTVEHVSRWGSDGPWVRVLNVPGWKCQGHGDVVFDGDVVDRLQELVRAGRSGALRVEEMAVKEFGGG